MEFLIILPIVFTAIGWMVIYEIASNNSERAEIRGLVSRTIDVLEELEKESIDALTSSNIDVSSNKHTVIKITSKYGWFGKCTDILKDYITIKTHLYKNLNSICTKDIEERQNLNPSEIEDRILEISRVTLTIKYRLEKAFIEKYHNKDSKNY